MLSQALDETVRVRLTTYAPNSGRRAIVGQDFDMPEYVLVPAGETKVYFTVRTTAPDYTTTGHSAAEVRLAALPAGECFPYTVDTTTGPQVVIRDSSREIPEDCKTKVDISMDRNPFKMAEGETVNYSIYLSGPAPTVFPIVIKWEYANPDGYRVNASSLDRSHAFSSEVLYTQADWNARRGKPLSLTISDPSDEIDGDGKVLVAHHFVYNVEGLDDPNASTDPAYSSVHCLQTPQALKMTQMLVKVTDVPTVSGQQKAGSDGSEGEEGRIKRPDPPPEPEVEEIPQEPEEQPEPQKEGEEPAEETPETTTTTTQPPPTTTTTAPPPTTTTTRPPPTTTTTRPKLQKRDCSGLKAAFDAEVAAYTAAVSPTNWPDSGPMHAAQGAWRACLAGQ